MRIYCLLILLFISNEISAQDTLRSTSENLICRHLFGEYQHEEHTKRRAVLKSNGSFVSKINPLRLTATGLMFVYQNVFSEQISSNCMYEISCSEMTKKSIESVGMIKGSFIGLHQLTNCSTNIVHDHERFEISKDGKIINHIPSDE